MPNCSLMKQDPIREMKILVTGGNGQLGRSLRKISGEYPGYTFVFTDLPEVDITDAAAMEKFMAGHKPQAIINCAAYTAVDRAESEPELAAGINILGPGTLAALAAERKIPLVHISTDYVFNGRATEPYDENDRADPTGVYGRTKYEGELKVLMSGANAVVVRTSWLYSEFGSNFLKTMLRVARERSEVNVVDDQFGTPTYATDLANAIMLLVGKGIKGKEIYHFSDEGVISWHGFAEEIFRQAHKHIKVNPIPTAAYPTAAVRPAYSVLDKAKMKAIGVVIPFWKDSLAECLEQLEVLEPELLKAMN